MYGQILISNPRNYIRLIHTKTAKFTEGLFTSGCFNTDETDILWCCLSDKILKFKVNSGCTGEGVKKD